MTTAKLEKELGKAIQRRDELASDRAAVQVQLSAKRDEMGNTLFEGGGVEKLLTEIQKLKEKDQALGAALGRAEAVISDLSNNLAESRKAAALKELDRLRDIGEKHIIGFFAGLYQAGASAEAARKIYGEAVEVQKKHSLGVDTCQLRELLSWIDRDELQLGILLKNFDQAHPEMSKAAQR